MALTLYDSTDIQGIANAIRSKNVRMLNRTMKVSEMAGYINSITTEFEVLPQDQATGALANFPDGSNLYPIVEGIFGIEPIQEGTGDPSPSNIRPISGFTGMVITALRKNLFTSENSEVDKFVNDQGTTQASTGWLASDYIKVPKNTTLYFNPNTTAGTTAKHCFYDINKNFISAIASGEGTFTTPINCAYMRFSYRSTSDNIQLEVGSTATSFQEYDENINAPTVSWQDQAGTVYGGSLNLTTGVLTVDRAYFNFDGSVSVNAVSQSSGVYFVTVVVNLESENTTSSNKTVISDKFVTRTGLTGGDNHCYITNSGKTLVCVLADQTITTKEGATQWFEDNPSTFVYVLATPITYQLTPRDLITFLGVNNIWCDTGDADITYRADVALYIDKITT